LDTSEQIIKRIYDCGWSAYLCGGAVRDIFLGIEPHDFDIVTDATPSELASIFPDRKVDLVGASFLVTLIDQVEVATYRTDTNYGPNRSNCITKACKTLEEDLLRRDFTFNAMAVCPHTGEIIDYFHGREDLEKKVVRFVGKPFDRIYEDYLRMIRAARFACLIEGDLETETFRAIKDYRNSVKAIAPERIRTEILKVMCYRKPSIFFDILHETGILEIILPDFDKLYGHTGGQYHAETLDKHSKETGDSMSPKDPILRLAGYLHDIGKPLAYRNNNGQNFIDHEHIGKDLTKDILEHFKFTNHENKRITGLVRYHMRTMPHEMKDKYVRRMLKDFSDNDISWKDWLKLKIADHNANKKTEQYPKEFIKNSILKIHTTTHFTESGGFKITDLNINGNDIMKLLDIKPGPKVGEVLNKLLHMVVDDPAINTRETLINIVERGEYHGFTNR
jgi:tRNA nucleotidyltransferase (CCA-adding enzyme)